MMPWSDFWLFVVACVLLVLTPGPNLLYLISRTLCQGRAAGVVSLAVDGGGLAVVLLSVFPGFQGHGVGRALLDAAVKMAAERSLPGVKAAISNDDVPSFSFYQRHGFVIDTVAKGLLADRYGSAEPGFSGIPVRDEIRLRRSVCPI